MLGKNDLIPEDIISTIQKCISLRPLIVLGSGASCEYGIPGMGELADYLFQNIEPNRKYNSVVKKLKRLLLGGEGLEEALQKVRVPIELENKIIHLTREIILFNDQSISKKIILEDIDLPLTRLLIHLSRTANPSLTIITTNYDRIAEYSIDRSKLSFNTNFYGKYIGYNNGFQEEKGRRYVVELLKVHGSIDWVIDKTGNVFSIPDSSYDKGKHTPLIVTPGVRKYEHAYDEPFRSIIAKSDTAFDSAQSVLCIGYGFNDLHIQPRLISRIMKDKIPMIIMAKKLTDKAIKFIETSSNDNIIGIEESSPGCIIKRNGSRATIELPVSLWQLNELIKISL